MSERNGNMMQLAQVLLVSLGVGCAALTATPPDDTSLGRGKVVFEQHCLACHGAQGKGDGYPFLKPPPADLSAFAVRNRTDAKLAETIQNGHPGTAMGAWKVALTEEEIRNVIAYVRTLQN